MRLRAEGPGKVKDEEVSYGQGPMDREGSLAGDGMECLLWARRMVWGRVGLANGMGVSGGRWPMDKNVQHFVCYYRNCARNRRLLINRDLQTATLSDVDRIRKRFHGEPIPPSLRVALFLVVDRRHGIEAADKANSNGIVARPAHFGSPASVSGPPWRNCFRHQTHW